MRLDFSSRDTRINLILLLSSLGVSYLIVLGVRPFFPAEHAPDLSHIEEKDAETIRAIVTEESPGIYRPIPDPDVVYLLQRSIRKEAFRTVIRTNQAGLRGATLTEKAPGAFRIVCLGDSVTFGYKVEEEESYPSQLREILSHATSGKVEVINCGVPSWNIRSEAHFLRARLHKLRPDFVVWQIHDNDLGATMGVAEGGFATHEFSPQERTLGISYFDGKSVLLTSTLQERLRRASEEVRDLAHLLDREKIGLLLYFVCSNPVMFATLVHGFAELVPDLAAIRHPKPYLAKKYRLSWDPHFNPDGNRILATSVAWALREEMDLSRWRLPKRPEALALGTTVADLAAAVSLEKAQRGAWEKVSSRFIPSDPFCQHLSLGVMKFGWVAKYAEFPLRKDFDGPAKIRIEGEFLGYPQLTPLRIRFDLSGHREEVTLVKKGPFTVEWDLPANLQAPESRYGGILVRCTSDKYCSTLTDHRRLSWVLKSAEVIPAENRE